MYMVLKKLVTLQVTEIIPKNKWTIIKRDFDSFNQVIYCLIYLFRLGKKNLDLITAEGFGSIYWSTGTDTRGKIYWWLIRTLFKNWIKKILTLAQASVQSAPFLK